MLMRTLTIKWIVLEALVPDIRREDAAEEIAVIPRTVPAQVTEPCLHVRPLCSAPVIKVSNPLHSLHTGNGHAWRGHRTCVRYAIVFVLKITKDLGGGRRKRMRAMIDEIHHRIEDLQLRFHTSEPSVIVLHDEGGQPA